MKITKIGCPVSAPGMRDNGTYSHVRHALKRELGKDLQWFYRGQIPKDNDCDFWLYVDDGLDHIPMECPKPNACWLIDTHLGWDIRRKWAEHFDTVFCAQLPAVEAMKDDGINAYWLPLACNPLAHPNQSELMVFKRVLEEQLLDPDTTKRESAMQSLVEIFMDGDLTKAWDVVFVGYMNRGVERHSDSHDRVEYLDRICKAFPNAWVNVNCFHEAAAARYVKGRVGLNVSILADLNMRFFEIPSFGTAMLANTDVVGWKELGFQDGVHFFGYEGVEDAIEKCRWMLKNPIEREQVAGAGHVFVRENHTYKQRMETLLKICEDG